MNLEEFKEKIKMAQGFIKENRGFKTSEGVFIGHYTCHALNKSMKTWATDDTIMTKKFLKIFEGKGYFNRIEDGFFGPPRRENVPKRLKVLEEFEKICIEKGYYKEF